MNNATDPTGKRRPRLTDPLGEETRAYGTRLLFRLALAVALAAGVSLVAGLWPATGGLWRLGALALLLAAGVTGVVADRTGRPEGVRRAFVLLLVAGYVAAALASAFGGALPGLVGLWLLAWFGVLVLATGLLLGRVWALAITVLSLGATLIALIPSVARADGPPAAVSGAEVVILSPACFSYPFRSGHLALS